MPRLALIATGGTIAGAAASATETTAYQAGALPGEALLTALPSLRALAEWRLLQPFNLDSKDMTPAHWLVLARLVQQQLDDPQIDGVVITHGTDTLAETAWLLHLLVHGDKPVVLTAAMRPGTALSADGPMNLWEAANVACSAEFASAGVLVAVAGAVYSAEDFRKCHTTHVHAFDAPLAGPLGYSAPPLCLRAPVTELAGIVPRARWHDWKDLPAVEVLWVLAGSSPAVLEALPALGVQGAVLALPGNGSVPSAWLAAILKAQAAGLKLVRASHVPGGRVHGQQAIAGLISSEWRSPAQARILLMLDIASGGEGELLRAARMM
jgi:L-asparaginase